MSVEFDFKTSFMCEDIRSEASGAMSFMGAVTDGEYAFTAFPARVRMGIIVICDVVGAGEATLHAALRLDGEIKWAGETDLEVDDDGTGIMIPLGHINAQFDQPGKLELLVSTESTDIDSVRPVKTWNIVGLTDEGE